MTGKRKIAVSIVTAEPVKKISKSIGSHRKVLSPNQIVVKYGAEGFHIGENGLLYCLCSKRPCGENWDKSMIQRHINGKTHQRIVKGNVDGAIQTTSNEHKERLRRHHQQLQHQKRAIDSDNSLAWVRFRSLLKHFSFALKRIIREAVQLFPFTFLI